MIPALRARVHQVRALVRSGSEKKLPTSVLTIQGNALAPDSIPMVSIEVATKAGREAGVRHLVYPNVAQPAPMMQVYINVRQRGEAMLRETGIPLTVVRPWYVFGPGHWWPYAIIPVYWLMEILASTRESARRPGLVTIRQVLNSLVWAVENPPQQLRILGVPEIRQR